MCLACLKIVATMTKSLSGPVIAVIISIIAVAGIYLGLPTKNEDQRQIEKSRAINFEKVSIPVVLREALANLSEEERVYLSELENESDDEDKRTESLKTLSKEWFERNEWLLAGYYAEKVAQVDSLASSWAIAGNTYSIGMQRFEDANFAEYAKKAAIRNYESAISVEPKEVEYRINLAVTYAERPDTDNPMKGVMMLLDLDKEHPEDARVQNTLAYYAIQTGQIEKAFERLSGVLERDPENSRANCLMVRLLKKTGETKDLAVFEARCN